MADLPRRPTGPRPARPRAWSKRDGARVELSVPVVGEDEEEGLARVGCIGARELDAVGAVARTGRCRRSASGRCASVCCGSVEPQLAVFGRVRRRLHLQPQHAGSFSDRSDVDDTVVALGDRLVARRAVARARRASRRHCPARPSPRSTPTRPGSRRGRVLRPRTRAGRWRRGVGAWCASGLLSACGVTLSVRISRVCSSRRIGV